MSQYPTVCPIDGCNRGPFDSEAALRGHANGSAADGHTWDNVTDQLEKGESPDGKTNDSPEEGDTEGDNPTGDGDGDADMPTQAEYEDQHATDGDGTGSGDDTGDTPTAAPTAALPVDPKTLGMLLAVALVMWVAYRTLAGPGGSDQPTAATEGGKSGDDSATGGEEVAGGLTG